MRRSHRRLALGFFRAAPRRDLLERALSNGITEVDVSASYHRGHAHRLLATAAGELLDQFTISTKVSPRSDLAALKEQTWRAADELGTGPAAVLVHKPERTLSILDNSAALRWWSSVAETMTECVAAGACRSWGIACWDPRPAVPVIADTESLPRPDVAMVRVGLLVPASVLTAAEDLLTRLRLAPVNRWGMSPFAGDPGLLTETGIHQFLGPAADAGSSTTAVALASAWHLPRVARLAVGTASTDHLAELVAAGQIPVDADRIKRYRRWITARRAATS